MPTTPGSAISSPAADGSTLKVTAPTPLSPINDQKPATGPARLVATPSTAPFVPAISVRYRFQIFNNANQMVDDSLEDAPTYDVTEELTTNARYTWRARAEGINTFGPWSTNASFIAPESAFLRGSEFADPLKNGRTVGVQHGGQFIPGEGWKALSTSDGITTTFRRRAWSACWSST